MKKTFLIILLFISTTILSQNYKQVKIYLNENTSARDLITMGIRFEHAAFEKDNSIIVFITDDEFKLLRTTSFKYEVLIEDWYEYYNKLPKLSSLEKSAIIRNSAEKFGVEGLTFGSMGGYHTFDEIVAQLDSMYIMYPNIITQKFSIGTTHEGREIWAVKISDNPNINEDEPQTMSDALLHAREAATNTTVLYYMYYLLENYGIDEEVTYLVNNREIYFVPCVNPDGYEYNRSTNPNGGGMWRKNRRNNGSGIYGVDLNRNFGYKWGYDNIGSGPNPSDIDYRGPSAFSEPETQALRNFFNNRNIKTYINYHCYSDVIIFPWGYIDQNCPDSLIFMEYSSDMSFWNGYPYGTANATIGYNANGGSIDWTYGEQTEKDKIISYTFELGNFSDGFWAQQNRIFPIAQANLQPNLYNTWVAGEFVSVVGAEYSHEYFNPGDIVELNPICKNKGLSAGYNISIDFRSGSSQISIQNNSLSFDSLQAQTTSTIQELLSFSISSSAPIGELAYLIFDVKTNGILMSTDTLEIAIGTPTILFEDDENDPATFWNLSGLPSTIQWEATEASFYSSPYSYTESKYGNYASHEELRMVSKNLIDLSGSDMPVLTFWTKYNIENNWDCGQVLISTNNGTSWIALEGSLTEPGSGNGEQPLNQPVYEGNQQNWVYEEIDLSAYTGMQIMLNFEFRSDATIEYDGWSVDDIKVFYYGIVPVELTSFTVLLLDNSVQLKWQTATELNNLGFEVQKSIDEKEWASIGFIEGKGTSNEINEYRFIDDNLLNGKSFYRLVQVDFDGTKDIIAKEVTTYSPKIEYELQQNYPNPFNPSTKIKYSIKNDDNVRIKLYNIMGEEIAEIINEYQLSGSYEVELNVSDFNISSGIYFYSINSGTFRKTNKMIILK